MLTLKNFPAQSSISLLLPRPEERGPRNSAIMLDPTVDPFSVPRKMLKFPSKKLSSAVPQRVLSVGWYMILRRGTGWGVGSFSIINPINVLTLPLSAVKPWSPHAMKFPFFTLVEVSWWDPYGGKWLLQLKLLRQQEEQLLTALEKMFAFNNNGKDPSASNLFVKSKWNWAQLTWCY